MVDGTLLAVTPAVSLLGEELPMINAALRALGMAAAMGWDGKSSGR